MIDSFHKKPQEMFNGTDGEVQFDYSHEAVDLLNNKIGREVLRAPIKRCLEQLIRKVHNREITVKDLEREYLTQIPGFVEIWTEMMDEVHENLERARISLNQYERYILSNELNKAVKGRLQSIVKGVARGGEALYLR